MAELSTASRKRLSGSSFAIPERRAYPIHDEAHARNALARVSQHGTTDEKRRVRAAVRRRYPGIEVSSAQQGALVTGRNAMAEHDVGSVTQEKACKILEDGTIRGEPLSRAQQAFFGARCSGQPERAENGALVLNSVLMDVLNESPNMTIPAEED